MALIGHATPIAARHYDVTIQAATDVDPGSGFPTETFVDLARAQAAREPLMSTRGLEQFAEGQVTARAYHQWTVPYDAAIDPDLVAAPKMRLLYENRAYDILEAHTIGMHAEIVFTTMVRAA